MQKKTMTFCLTKLAPSKNDGAKKNKQKKWWCDVSASAANSAGIPPDGFPISSLEKQLHYIYIYTSSDPWKHTYVSSSLVYVQESSPSRRETKTGKTTNPHTENAIGPNIISQNIYKVKIWQCPTFSKL